MIARLALRWRRIARHTRGTLPEDPAQLGLLLLLCGFPLLSTAMHRWIFYLGAILVLLQPDLMTRTACAARRHPVFVATLVYLALHLLSIAWSPVIVPRDVGVAMLSALGIILMMLFAVHVAESVPENDIARTWVQFQVFTTAVALVLIANNLLDGSMERLAGVGQVKNPIIAAVIFGAAWLSALAGRKRLKTSVGTAGSIAVLIILAVFIVMTDSRGPMLALAASTLALFALERRWHLVIGVIVAAIAFGLVFFAGALDEITMMQRGASSRLEIWRDAWTDIIQRPWFGHGVLVEPRFSSLSRPEGQKSTHSLYLGTLFYTGIVGLGSLFAVFATLAIELLGRQLNDMDRAFASLLVFGATSSLVEFHTLFTELDPEWLLFWIPIALLTGRAIQADKSR